MRGSRQTQSGLLISLMGWGLMAVAPLLGCATSTGISFALAPLELADSEVQPSDIITMVGFSFGTSSPPAYGVRHFGENRVNRLIPLETGSTVFRVEEQVSPDGGTASHAQQGDSGGACIKRGTRNLLVGITTVGGTKPTGEPMSFFTSVYAHRPWLLQMLRKADES